MNKDYITTSHVILISLMGGCIHFATERIIFYLSNSRFDNLDKQLIYGCLILFIVILATSFYITYKIKLSEKKPKSFMLATILAGLLISIEGFRVIFSLLY